MGKLNIFEITLNNFSGVFYAGSVVDGHVTVEVTAPMTVKGLNFFIHYFVISIYNV